MYKYNTRKIVDELLNIQKELTILEVNAYRRRGKKTIEAANEEQKRLQSKLEAFKRRLIVLIDLHERLYNN